MHVFASGCQAAESVVGLHIGHRFVQEQLPMARSLRPSVGHQLTEDITTGMYEWRNQHPKATLREIETELDMRLARARARMLEDLALQSTAASWQDAARLHTPSCPECGTPLHERGTHSRTLLTQGGQELTLERSYGACPSCGSGFFPPR
jgi:YgiT-type zinc finger domain-containing protein